MDISIAKKGNKKKRTQINWGLLALGSAGIISYLWDKEKKKKIAQAQAQAYKDRLLPPVKQQITLPAETSTSPDARLSAMGVDTGKASAYQAGENFKER